MDADWGVSRWLTIVRTESAHGEVREDVENPRWFQESKARLIDLDQAVSRKKQRSRSWRNSGRARSVFRSQVARRRHDHQRQPANFQHVLNVLHDNSKGVSVRLRRYVSGPVTLFGPEFNSFTSLRASIAAAKFLASMGAMVILICSA